MLLQVSHKYKSRIKVTDLSTVMTSECTQLATLTVGTS